MKKTIATMLLLGILLGATLFPQAAIEESSLLGLLEEISDVPQNQLDQYVDILDSYLANDTTIQNLSDDIGFLYASVLEDSQRQKLESRNISVDEISEEVLLLKGWEDGDYALLIGSVAERDKDGIEYMLEKHGIISEKQEGASGGGLPAEEIAIEDAQPRFCEMQPARQAEFSDTKGHWAEENIERLYSIGLINGRSDEIFDPESRITRAEYLTLLARVLRLPAGQEGAYMEFTDISQEAWYREEVLAACAAGLARGNEDGTFAPSKSITRQEMAVMTMNALKYINENSVAAIDLTRDFSQTFVDIDSIAPWAIEAMGRLNGLGLMMGDGGLLRPCGNTTRAESAAVLARLIETAEI